MTSRSSSARSPSGRSVASALPYERWHGALGDTVRAEWHRTDAFVLVVAVGAAVRVVAPLLSDKRSDPVIVCVDDTAQFVVPTSAAIGRPAPARAGTTWPGRSRLLDATPVITTATDASGSAALDQLAGFAAEGDVAGATAALLDGCALQLDNPLHWPLPA